MPDLRLLAEREWKVRGPREGPAAGATVLVVDDEPDTLQVVAEVLEEAGYFTVAAPDGETARRLLGLVRFEVVVSDVVMPGLDGLQLLGVIRREAPSAQVVLMSGRTTGAAALDAWRRGAAGLLAKPISPDRLVDAVAAAVVRCRRERRAGSARRAGPEHEGPVREGPAAAAGG
jgi:DNA-binding NtrC family response regulator